jgi:hypothetical protein
MSDLLSSRFTDLLVPLDSDSDPSVIVIRNPVSVESVQVKILGGSFEEEWSRSRPLSVLNNRISTRSERTRTRQHVNRIMGSNPKLHRVGIQSQLQTLTVDSFDYLSPLPQYSSRHRRKLAISLGLGSTGL